MTAMSLSLDLQSHSFAVAIGGSAVSGDRLTCGIRHRPLADHLSTDACLIADDAISPSHAVW